MTDGWQLIQADHTRLQCSSVIVLGKGAWVDQCCLLSLPLDEAIAFRAVIVIVSGSDGLIGTNDGLSNRPIPDQHVPLNPQNRGVEKSAFKF